MQAVKTSWLLSNVDPASDCNKVIASPASLVVTNAGPTRNYMAWNQVILNTLKKSLIHNLNKTCPHSVSVCIQVPYNSIKARAV